jgi:glucosamine-6-phosphate deaminase
MAVSTGLTWHVADSAADFARLGADVIQQEWSALVGRAVLVATGATPMPVYAELASRLTAGEFVVPPDGAVVQLDEYVGVDDDDPRSLFRWFERSFITPLGVPEERVVRLHGDAPDPSVECARFQADLDRAGGIGLAILGLGPNGHLGFNEPPSAPDSLARPVELTEASLRSNAPYWGGRAVPTRALTTGMASILAAEVVVLLVAGTHKRAVLGRAVEGPVTDDLPASHLRRVRRLIVVADRHAVGSLG